MVIPTLERESLDNKVQVSLRDPVSKHKMSDLRDHIKAWHLSYKYMHTNTQYTFNKINFFLKKALSGPGEMVHWVVY